MTELLREIFTKKEKDSALEVDGQYDTCAAFNCEGTDTHEVNIPLLRKILEDKVFNPTTRSGWDQSKWGFLPDLELTNKNSTEQLSVLPVECKTAFCVAGHVVNETGNEMDWKSGDTEIFEIDDDVEIYGYSVGQAFFRGKNNVVYRGQIEDIATHLLGLTNQQAGKLFSGDNTMEQIRDLAEDLGVEGLVIPEVVEA